MNKHVMTKQTIKYIGTLLCALVLFSVILCAAVCGVLAIKTSDGAFAEELRDDQIARIDRTDFDIDTQEDLFWQDVRRENFIREVSDWQPDPNATYMFNQLVQNGNFDTTNGWSTYNCSLSVSNNVAIVQASAYLGAFYRLSNNLSIISGHKYLVSVDMKCDHDTYSNVGFRFHNTNYYVTLSSTWSTLSGLYVATDNASGTFAFQPFRDANSSNFMICYVSNCMLFDLTAMGLESIASVDQFIQLFPSQYYPYTSLPGTMITPSYQVGYDTGYDDGITYADGRVNTDSASYNAGYNAGFSWALDRSYTYSNLYSDSVTSRYVTFSDFPTILSGFNYISTRTTVPPEDYNRPNLHCRSGYNALFNYNNTSVLLSDEAFDELVKYSPTFSWSVSYVRLDSASSATFYSETLLVGTDLTFHYRGPTDNSSYLSFSLFIGSDNVCDIIMYDNSTYFYFPTLASYNRYYINFNASRSPNLFDAKFSLGLPTESTAYLDGYNVGVASANSVVDPSSASYQYVLNNVIDSSASYTAGYNAGVESGSNYSFYSLMDSVALAPVTMISRMLDFEILGMNMRQLFLSLFTIGLVLFIIHLFLGKG